MVFCRDCNKRVEDCPHFVSPLGTPEVEVFDPKVKTLAYNKEQRILEIRFKNGQVWQLFGVPPDVYQELVNATLSSILKFLAPRYKSAPVRQPDAAAPASEPCPACSRPMAEEHRTSGGALRILWHCGPCNQSLWRSYAKHSVRERGKR